MREIYEKVSTNDVVTTEKTVVSEEITNYTVNRINKFISVITEKKDVYGETIIIETHYFVEKDFIEEPKESDLWTLIDNLRNN